MATNRNFIVKQGIEVGLNANAGSTWTANAIISNKSDITAPATMYLDFTSGFIDSRIKSSRNTTATYHASNNKIAVVSANRPRLDWDLNSGLCLGLVAEEQRTNYCINSDIEGVVGQLPSAMFLATYADQTCVVSTDVWIGPNKQSAKHTRGTGSDNNVGYNTGTFSNPSANQIITHSVYVYIPSNTYITLCGISLESGTLTLSPNPFATANLSIRDRWQRISGTAVATSGTGSAVPVLRMDPAGAVVYTDCWQVEYGEYASTYIPTQTSSVTRAGDYSYMSLAGIHDPVSTAFSVITETSLKWTANSTSSVLLDSDSSPSATRGSFSFVLSTVPATQYGGPPYYGYGAQYVYSDSYSFSFNSRILANNTPGSATSGTSTWTQIQNTGYTFNTFTANTILKGGYAVSNTQTRVILNGNSASIAVGNNYNNTITTDTLLLGLQYAGGVGPLDMGGYVRKFSYFPRLLSNNELIVLTET